MDALKTILEVNLFWFSLPVIGYAALLWLSRSRLWSYGSKVANILLAQHVFTVVVGSLAIAVGMFSLLALPLYIFKLPAIVPMVVYIILIALSCIYLSTLALEKLFSTESPNIYGLQGQTLLVRLLFYLLCVLLILDFLVTTFLVPAFPWGDGIFHMGRVVSILADGFNIQSSFFHHLPEGGYLYNVTYVLYAVPALLFDIEPIKVWQYSLGFFRFALWLAIFALTYHIFRNWLKIGVQSLLFSIIGTLLSISVYSAQFFTANYPSKIALLWMILIVMCLSVSGKKQIRLAGPIIVALSYLLATTHTTYALIVGSFLVLLISIRLLVLGKAYAKAWTIAPYLISAAILLTGPVVAKMMPVRASQDLIEVAKIDTISVFNMTMLSPTFPKDLMTWVVVVVSLASMITVFIMLYKRKLVYKWTLFLVAISMYPLIVYTPPVFTVFSSLMPAWLIQRFSAINVFVFVSTGFILFVLYIFIQKIGGLYFTRAKMTRQTPVWVRRMAIITVVIIAGSFGIYSAKESYALLLEDRADKTSAYRQFEKTAATFNHILKDNDIVISPPTHSYYLSALFNIDILATEYGHSPLAADGKNRDLCRIKVLESLSYTSLDATGAKYVMLSPYEDMARERLLANNASYLKEVARDEYYILYEFTKDNSLKVQESVYKPCLDYQRMEGSLR